MVAAVNPFRLLRTTYNISDSKVGDLSRVTVYRIESGQYEELSDRMYGQLALSVVAKGADSSEIGNLLEERYGTRHLDDAYKEWRKAARRRQAQLVPLPSIADVQAYLLGSPIEAFAVLYAKSVSSFCSRMCLQEPTVSRYMSGAFSYHEPPQSLVQALDDAGYADKDKLFELQRKWLDAK